MSLFSFAKKEAKGTTQKKKAEPKAAVKEKETKSAKKPTSTVTLAVARIGLVPLVTEKSVGLQADHNIVAFRVRPDATKGMIARAFADRYQVEPVSIRVLNMRGKLRRRGRTTGSTAAWKKVYVQLPAGKTIDITA